MLPGSLLAELSNAPTREDFDEKPWQTLRTAVAAKASTEGHHGSVTVEESPTLGNLVMLLRSH